MQKNKYIPNDILETFLTSFEIGDIWQVHQLNEIRLIVFLFRNDQIESNKGLPIYQEIKDEYFKLVKHYLNINYFNSADISIQFDSKENFENKYQSNWHFYYR
jgi:hypothetical protein